MSKAIFGNDNFLAVSQYVKSRRSRATYVRQIAAATGLPDAVVRPIVHRLVVAGALRESESLDRTIRYIGNAKHPLWSFVSTLGRHETAHHQEE
jgi:hypothetical protein